MIHHPGSGSSGSSGTGSVTTVTHASNMSNKWTKSHDIQVNGTKTVQDAYNGAGGRTSNPLINYITAGTCIGAASGVEKTLGKKWWLTH